MEITEQLLFFISNNISSIYDVIVNIGLGLKVVLYVYINEWCNL